MPAQTVGVELYYDAAWHDAVPTPGVFMDSVTIRQGLGDESGGFRPCQITAQLNNADDRFRVSNPASTLYGKIGRNTPIRVKIGGTIRGAAEASSWSADQTQDFRMSPPRGKAWVDVTAGGLLQRIGQWTQKLQSAFRAYNDTLTTSVGYWPGEQARGSTTLDSPTSGVSGPVFTAIAPDSQYRPPSSAPLLDMNANSEIGANFVRNGTATSTSGWQLSWVARYAPLVPGEQDIFDWQTTDGTGYGLYLNPTTGNMLIYSSKGGAPVLTGAATSYGGYDWSQWTMFTLDAQYSAGTTTVWVNWVNADGTKSGFMNASFTGVPASLLWWDASTFAGVPVGSTIGHVVGTNASSVSGADNLFGTGRKNAWYGYDGERAAVRFGRLCTQLGVPYYVSSGYLKSMPMGPQGTDTFVNLVKEIVATEDALLYDHGSELRLFLLCRADRYNQTPTLTLTPSDFPALPKEVTDDLVTANTVTVSQRDGADVTVQDTTGPLGTQPPPAGVGAALQEFAVSLDDPDNGLVQLATWYLRRGTVNLPRFPTITLDLNANPSLIPEVEATSVGSVVTITGLREYVIRLYVLGWTETVGTHTRSITYVCAPDQQFVVGVYDDTTRRYDLRTSTMNASAAAGVTSVVFKQTSDEAWSTTSTPYDLLIAGERVTVTAMGARSGTGPWTQTATVTRAVNGIAKTLPSGAEVHIATPGRWAL